MVQHDEMLDSPATAADTLRKMVHQHINFMELYLSDTLERIAIIRAGLPAQAVELMSEDLDVPKELLYRYLGVNRATVTRLVREDKSLDSGATERAVFLAGLVRMVDDMLPDGDKSHDFDAAKWVARWLDTPQPALKGAAPKDYLDTAEGRAIIRRLLSSIESGAYV